MPDKESLDLRSAKDDYYFARQKAVIQDILARFTGKPVDLLSYEEIRRKLKAQTVIERGVRDIPLDAIIAASTVTRISHADSCPAGASAGIGGQVLSRHPLKSACRPSRFTRSAKLLCERRQPPGVSRQAARVEAYPGLRGGSAHAYTALQRSHTR